MKTKAILLAAALVAFLLLMFWLTEPAGADPILTYDQNTGDVQLIPNGMGVESLIVDSASSAMLPNANFPDQANPAYWVNDPDEYSWFAFGFPQVANFDCGQILPAGLSNPFIQSDLLASYQTTDTAGNQPLAIETLTPEPCAMGMAMLCAAAGLRRHEKRR